jgi:enoyl-CoA hydratase
MTYKNLKLETRDQIALLTFNRPQVLNALNAETIGELEQAVDVVEGDDDVRALILTGAGEKAFVAGADINELAASTPSTGQKTALRGQAVFGRIERLTKPVIAAINGFALGGGLELALACHLRIAASGAKLGLPEVKLGIMPGYGGTQRLARLVGKSRALEWILTGEMMEATEAHRIGLVNRVVPRAELLDAAHSLTRMILARGPLAIAFSIEAVSRGLEGSLEEGLLLEASLFGVLCSSDDMKEGTKAFLEKRDPRFTGR